LESGPDNNSPSVVRFLSCRWRKAAEDGVPDHCTHRDVLPMAGKEGFKPIRGAGLRFRRVDAARVKSRSRISRTTTGAIGIRIVDQNSRAMRTIASELPALLGVGIVNRIGSYTNRSTGDRRAR
jgi:hypothetical protein